MATYIWVSWFPGFLPGRGATWPRPGGDALSLGPRLDGRLGRDLGPGHFGGPAGDPVRLSRGGPDLTNYKIQPPWAGRFGAPPGAGEGLTPRRAPSGS